MIRQLGATCLGLALLVTAQGQQPTKDKKDPKPAKPLDYYPLQIGNAWHYKGGGAGKTTVQVTSSEVANGQTLAVLDTPSAKLTEHVSQSDKGVFRHRINGLEVSPPFCLIKYPATVGTRWDGEFTVAKEAGQHKYRGEIQSEEVVDVPAGKFKAIRVMIQLDGENTSIKSVFWFAPDIGLVKQAFDSASVSITLALEKFDRKK